MNPADMAQLSANSMNAATKLGLPMEEADVDKFTGSVVFVQDRELDALITKLQAIRKSR